MSWLSVEEIEDGRVVAEVAILYYLCDTFGFEPGEVGSLVEECLAAIILAKRFRLAKWI